MTFPPDTRIGATLKEVLGLEDWVYDIEITPNRPDCLSVIGVAREVAGILGRPLKYPRLDMTAIEDPGVPVAADQASVEIMQPEYCPRYTARVVNNVIIKPSPFWLVDRLAGVGQRPINNVVDITNFVMMEIGQPLHAFDLARLEESRIVVKTASEGERFETLDGMERINGPGDAHDLRWKKVRGPGRNHGRSQFGNRGLHQRLCSLKARTSTRSTPGVRPKPWN